TAWRNRQAEKMGEPQVRERRTQRGRAQSKESDRRATLTSGLPRAPTEVRGSREPRGRPSVLSRAHAAVGFVGANVRPARSPSEDAIGPSRSGRRPGGASYDNRRQRRLSRAHAAVVAGGHSPPPSGELASATRRFTWSASSRVRQDQASEDVRNEQQSKR